MLQSVIKITIIFAVVLKIVFANDNVTIIILGSPVTLTCITTGLASNFLTWKAVDSFGNVTLIWLSGAYQGTSSTLYSVTSTGTTNVNSTLTILNVIPAYLTYTYGCSSLLTSTTVTATLYVGSKFN